MPFADLGSLRLHYEIDGEGPPLILLAGMMSDSASWGPVVPDLSRSFTVIRPDNRTTGRTEPGDGPVTLDRWVGDVIALMDFLELGRAHVAGHSLGGIMALHLAATAPERLDRLALLAAAPLFLQRNLFFFRHLLSLRGEGLAPDLWLRGLYPWLFHPRTFDDAAMVETLIALSLSYPHAQGTGAFAAQIDGYAGAETALVLPAVLPPTCAILARDDLIMPISEARHALERLGPVDVVEVPNAGHSVHWDAPDAVVAALLGHFGGRA